MHGEEAQFAFLKSTLGESVGQTDEKLRREIRKAFSRKVAGVAVFAFVGSGAMGHLIKAGFGQAMEKFFGEHQTVVPGIKKSIIEEIANRKAGNVMPKGEQVITAKADAMAAKVQAAAEKLAENKPAGTSGLAQGLAEQPASGFDKEELIKLAVKKGGSIEKSIIDYLGDHKDLIDKYNSTTELSGGHKLNAGQIAHRMALEYAKNKNIDFDKLNHIQPGDEYLSSDGMHLEGTPDRPPVLDPSQIDLKGIPTDSHGSPVFNLHTETPSGEPFSLDEPYADMPSQADLPNIESHIPENIPGDASLPVENLQQVNNLTGAETMLSSVPSEEAIKQGAEIAKKISNGSWDNWKEMQGMTFTRARQFIMEHNLGRHRGWNLTKVVKEYARLVGEKEAKPLRGETLRHWMSRMAKAMAEKNKTISV